MSPSRACSAYPRTIVEEQVAVELRRQRPGRPGVWHSGAAISGRQREHERHKLAARPNQARPRPAPPRSHAGVQRAQEPATITHGWLLNAATPWCTTSGDCCQQHFLPSHHTRGCTSSTDHSVSPLRRETRQRNARYCLWDLNAGFLNKRIGSGSRTCNRNRGQMVPQPPGTRRSLLHVCLNAQRHVLGSLLRERDIRSQPWTQRALAACIPRLLSAMYCCAARTCTPVPVVPVTLVTASYGKCCKGTKTCEQ